MHVRMFFYVIVPVIYTIIFVDLSEYLSFMKLLYYSSHVLNIFHTYTGKETCFFNHECAYILYIKVEGQNELS